MKTYALVLAAGKGTRMKTEMPKCAFPLLKKPMIEYIIESLEKSSIDEIITVVGHKKEVFEELLGNRVKYAFQKEQLGTGNAVLCAEYLIKEEGQTIIIPGDTPLIDLEIINNLLGVHKEENNDITIGTINLDNPFGFGRILRNEAGKIVKIIEEKDATLEQKLVNEINTGLYCIGNKMLFEALKQVKPTNNKGEYYLTDIIEILSSKANIGSFTIKETYKLNGINDLYTLSKVESSLRHDINKKHMINGVNIINSNTVTIAPSVIIDEGVTICQGSIITGDTVIKKGSIIGPYSEVHNSLIEENVIVKQSVIYDSKVSTGATVGPFSHLRVNSVVGVNDRIGNFVEMKNSTLGEKTNVAHLTYIGDCTCGDNVNWGCGTVTVNYDGHKKSPTKIGNNVFIGCNTNLVAPIEVGNDSFIAAGSTITESIGDGDFVIGRSRSIIKKGYANKFKNK